uniref:hypothetical protein n=1 Tax=Succinivibrio sp. TaxID=2053619 RepID=UPI00402AABA7
NTRAARKIYYSETSAFAHTCARSIIKSRDYGKIMPEKSELLRIACVFNAEPKIRAFTEYQSV